MVFGLKVDNSFDLRNAISDEDLEYKIDKLLAYTYFYNDLFYVHNYKFSSFQEGLLWFRSASYLSEYVGISTFYFYFYWSQT